MLDGLDRRNNADSAHQLFQFVGFLCAWNQPGHLPPLLAATLGALITTWTTFVPCFLWVFLFAVDSETLSHWFQADALIVVIRSDADVADFFSFRAKSWNLYYFCC